MYSENEWVWWLPHGNTERVLIKLLHNDSVFSHRWVASVGNGNYVYGNYVYSYELSKATDSEIVLWNLEN